MNREFIFLPNLAWPSILQVIYLHYNFKCSEPIPIKGLDKFVRIPQPEFNMIVQFL